MKIEQDTSVRKHLVEHVKTVQAISRALRADVHPFVEKQEKLELCEENFYGASVKFEEVKHTTASNIRLGDQYLQRLVQKLTEARHKYDGEMLEYAAMEKSNEDLEVHLESLEKQLEDACRNAERVKKTPTCVYSSDVDTSGYANAFPPNISNSYMRICSDVK